MKVNSGAPFAHIEDNAPLGRSYTPYPADTVKTEVVSPPWSAWVGIAVICLIAGHHYYTFNMGM